MQKEQDFPIASLAVSFLRADSIKAKAIPVSKLLTPWLAEHSANLLGSNFNCHNFSVSIHNQVTGLGGTQRYLRQVQRSTLGKIPTLLDTAGERRVMARDMGRRIHAIKEASYLSAKGISNRKERRDVEN